VSHFSPPLHEWVKKTVSGHVGSPFLAVKLFTHSVGTTIGQVL